MTGQVGTPDALFHTRPRVAQVGFKGLRPNQRLLLAETAIAGRRMPRACQRLAR